MKKLLPLLVIVCLLLASCTVTPAVPVGASLTDDWYREFPEHYCYKYSETIGSTEVTYTFAYDGAHSYKRMSYTGFDTTILDDGNTIYSLNNLNKTYAVVSASNGGENLLAGINLCSYGTPEETGIDGRLYYESFDGGTTKIWFDGRNIVRRSDSGDVQFNVSVCDFAASGISMALPAGYTDEGTKSFETEFSLPEDFFD